MWAFKCHQLILLCIHPCFHKYYGITIKMPKFVLVTTPVWLIQTEDNVNEAKIILCISTFTFQTEGQWIKALPVSTCMSISTKWQWIKIELSILAWVFQIRDSELKPHPHEYLNNKLRKGYASPIIHKLFFIL